MNDDRIMHIIEELQNIYMDTQKIFTRINGQDFKTKKLEELQNIYMDIQKIFFRINDLDVKVQIALTSSIHTVEK